MTLPSFAPNASTAAEEALRSEVREFLGKAMAELDIDPGLGISTAHRPEFSRRLAERGWVGMSIPTRYGGRGRSAVERFVVIEELLAAGAPVGAHWVADRQTAPSLLAFGTEQQRERFLPGIAAATTFFSLGMSEPDSGSDLASVRTAAVPVEGGWAVSGTKVWTTNAHLNDFFVVLCRTSQEEDRHAGLSQLIVDLGSPGVDVRPIQSLTGQHHFNIVTLTDVFVPADLVLGQVGDGWRQITTELSYERATPDRYMSTYTLLRSFLDFPGVPESQAAQARSVVAELTARLWAIRQMSLSVARMIDAGGAPATQAAMVKDLGTTFEQDCIAALREFLPAAALSGASTLFERLVATAILVGPTFTLRGGTNEILRSMIARHL